VKGGIDLVDRIVEQVMFFIVACAGIFAVSNFTVKIVVDFIFKKLDKKK
jgi:hypothetical protein